MEKEGIGIGKSGGERVSGKGGMVMIGMKGVENRSQGEKVVVGEEGAKTEVGE